MISQTVYYLIYASILVGKMSDDEKRRVVERTFKSASELMNRYHLWYFFTF